MLIADAILAKASKGDVAAGIFVRDTTEGKPVQALRIEPEMDEATACCLFHLAERLSEETDSLSVADAPDLPALGIGNSD